METPLIPTSLIGVVIQEDELGVIEIPEINVSDDTQSGNDSTNGQ